MLDRTHRILAIAALAAMVGVGCNSKSDEEGRVNLGADSAAPGSTLPAEVQAELDAGNTAFRAGDTQKALEHYQKATQLGPDFAAGWYGVVMAQQKLGNQAAADSAMARVSQLSPQLPAAHPSAPDTAGGAAMMPPGHPTSGPDSTQP